MTGSFRAFWPLPVDLQLVGLKGGLSLAAFPEDIWNVRSIKLSQALQALDPTPEEKRVLSLRGSQKFQDRLLSLPKSFVPRPTAGDLGWRRTLRSLMSGLRCGHFWF